MLSKFLHIYLHDVLLKVTKISELKQYELVKFVGHHRSIPKKSTMLINKGSMIINSCTRKIYLIIFRRMLVQRRIQEEIHGNKTTQNETRQTNNIHEHLPTSQQHSQSAHHVKRISMEPKPPNDRRSQSDERIVSSLINDQHRQSSATNASLDLIQPLSDNDDDDDDDMSTNEIVARNQSSKLEFHKTLTPMFV